MNERLRPEKLSKEKSQISQAALRDEILKAGYGAANHPGLQEGWLAFVRDDRAYVVDPQGLVGWQHPKRPINQSPLVSAIENLRRRTSRLNSLLRIPNGPEARRSYIVDRQEKARASLEMQSATRNH